MQPIMSHCNLTGLIPSDPNVALLLLAFGMIAIYVECLAPGLIFPGVIGSALAVIGLAGLGTQPLNSIGVTLGVSAIALFALEIKFAPHGALGLAGAVALVFGAVMLVDRSATEQRISLATAVGIAIPLSVITAFLATIGGLARRNKVVTGAEGMLGETAVALDDIALEGRVLVRGENWQAYADRAIARGASVRVRGIRNLLLHVEPLDASEKEGERR